MEFPALQEEILLIQQAMAEGNTELAETKLKLLYEQAIVALKAAEWELCEALLRDLRCVPEGSPVFDEYRGRANATIELLPLIRCAKSEISSNGSIVCNETHFTTIPKDKTAKLNSSVASESSSPISPTPSGPRLPRKL